MISLAGGLDSDLGKEIFIFRQDEAGVTTRIPVNLQGLVYAADPKLNKPVRPGDIIYVPPTPLAWVGLRMRELLYPVGPVLSGYTTPHRAMDAYDDYRYQDRRRDYYWGANDDDDEDTWRRILLR